ncbi:glycosyltransferase family 32 protein [Riemerella anatipestifer]|uniref:Glycosyltransferase sugar-binding region containing dxd motif n=1 Tax=Riemerella anatipestifer (strain ATCC 11845 / DSM 15868 / JCM 9532 / NCTC 11014) TaxID=693978 RepID=E4TCT8_RIEAD|nr:glycosyltransferase [Riemerella anatipestifer]ADQ82597.1 glycosyltransferase sugar-binding region containing DXD motif [Riemerella anatipestifer ATCC 11845 = DSM 15868]AFD56607.1 glycosyltransferase sugar-binding region containing dxd motif [Riemerella anatipestifer ATCC 11845 = DSM 15868]MRM93043.1 glycosyl transferase [Riemerella anatipestifer]MSN89667.1 glycosyl transferase [Riemerella anatipestifer]SNV65532.1 Mannosyltransferase OCH1 and related enzymes [Riemerella anatipestifer]
MIPKKIHYCWFGRGEKSDFIKFCIDSWKKIQPDFEIIEWNEDNFDVYGIPFTKEAYMQKKWAFVSDYARAKALYEHGGFYLDTDMELRLPLNDFLQHRAVCGFEMKGIPYSAFWAVEKGHELAKDIKEYYENKDKFEVVTNTSVFSKLLIDKYGANADNDSYQTLKHGVMLYPSNYFSLDFPKNYVVHHFSGSWHGAWSQEKNEFKNLVNVYGIMKLFLDIPNAKKEVKNVVYNHELMDIDKFLNQIPLSYILRYIKKQILKKIGL